MAGISSDGFEYLEGVAHIEQSLGKIITTQPGERVHREWFGNPGIFLLGNNMTQENILRYFAITWVLIELFEPRYTIQRFGVDKLSRGGVADFQMAGQYRPYAHLDWEQASAFVSLGANSVTLNYI